jgi:putative cardiolipin synthase
MTALSRLAAHSLFALMLTAWAVTGCASLPANVDRKPSQAWATPDQTALGQWVAQRRAQDRGRSDSGFVLLDTIETAYASRLALIKAAQRTVDLQYYAVHADGSTETLLEALRAAAGRGVRVRLLLDDFNTVGKDAQVLRLAFVPNVEIRLFNPLPGSRESLVGRVVTSIHDPARIAKRMHNKMFIVDNAIGITGGRNLGDAYFGVDGKSNFVDLDVMAAGRIVQDMSASFDHYWSDELAYPMQSLVTAQQLDEMRKGPEAQGDGESAAPAASAAGVAKPQAPQAGVMPDVAPAAPPRANAEAFDLRSLRWVWAPAALLSDKPGKVGPDDDEVNVGDTAIDGLLQLMDGAKQDVLIVSPYFVPGKQMVERFRKLKERGVRVRVLTNSLASNDAPAAHVGYARYRKDLLAIGVELHEMRATVAEGGGGTGAGSGVGSGGGGSKGNTSRASLHTKTMIIDGRTSMIGSMNLDLRSKTKNSEAGLVIRSRAIAQAATQVIDAMIARGSYRVALRPGGGLLWQAPPGADFKDSTLEPGATAKQRFLAGVIAPFAPDEML